MENGPVFVAGIARSGTSLMYALLASHPAIAMTRRTNLWRFFNNRYGALEAPGNFERCLAGIMRYRRLRVFQPDADRIRGEFRRGEPTYARLFSLLVEHHLERTGRRRWGDKSLNTERYVEEVFAAYPEARVLHMIRDPRDRYASARTRWGSGKGGVGAGTAMWLYSARLARRNEQRYPGRYRTVRYESLAAQPEATLREVCAFIGEEYTPAMLSMEGAGAFRDSGGNSSYGKREAGHISTRSIGRFRERMSKYELAFLQALAEPDMLAHGYRPEPVALSLAERLRFRLVHWPANLARVAGWRALEVVRDLTGRTPSPHTLTPGQSADVPWGTSDIGDQQLG